MGVGVLCGLFGKTRNAFYNHQRRATAQALLDGLVLALVADIRADLPRLGEYASRVSRDYLFVLLAAHRLLIRRRKRRVVTTQTCLPLFRRPNLIDHLTVHQAEQVWVSDITYVRLLSGWSYLSLITDLYSHKIVGACLHLDLSVRGDPYENAVAERVNGILKEEFDLGGILPGFTQADALVAQAVRAYKELRPHGSCDYLTPSQAHEQEGALVRRWRNYYYLTAVPAPI